MGTYEAELLGRETGIRVSNLIFHNVYGTPCDLGPRSQVIPALALRAARRAGWVIDEVWLDRLAASLAGN